MGSQCCSNMCTVDDGVSEGHVAFTMRTEKRNKLKQGGHSRMTDVNSVCQVVLSESDQNIILIKLILKF